MREKRAYQASGCQIGRLSTGARHSLEKQGQQHKNEKLFFKNLIFQKIGSEVVIITFSEFLMLFYGVGFFLMRITSWEVTVSSESVVGLEPLKGQCASCSIEVGGVAGQGAARTGFSLSSTTGHARSSI